MTAPTKREPYAASYGAWDEVGTPLYDETVTALAPKPRRRPVAEFLARRRLNPMRWDDNEIILAIVTGMAIIVFVLIITGRIK